MKNIYIILLSFLLLTGTWRNLSAQTLSVKGSIFLPQDSISFTYSDPAFTSTDWIGIYKSDQLPGPGSISWKYVKSDTGTLNLKAPQTAGKYKAFLLCCDGYDIVATSSEFTIEIPSLKTSFPSYVYGDSLVFSYSSPKFSTTDKLAIYPEGTKPGKDNPAIDWKYIPGSKGTLTFKTALAPGYYDAYLHCCDGYDSISACNFEVIDQSIAFITPSTQEFEAGANLYFAYNDPAFASGDWIGIFPDGEPTTGASITWSQIVSSSGIVSFPGVLASGYYIAVLFRSDQFEYARSVVFNVPERTAGSYVKTAANIYPEGFSILVNFKDENYSNKDWIGIYKKNQIPGGPEALLWNYVPGDSATIEFSSLPIGDYVVHLFCCDGYDVKAKYDFKVVGTNTASLVFSSIAYGHGDPLEFTYNDPNFDSGAGTDWIGIYKKGDIPSNTRSIIWIYLPDANGDMTFSVPYPNGTLPEEYPDTPLDPGEYWVGLFCCDAYGVYAESSFIVTEFGTGLAPATQTENHLNLFPNPTSGLVNIKIARGEKMQQITVYNLVGKVIYQEKPISSVNEKMLELKSLKKGIYFIDVLTENYKTSKKLIVQ